MHAEHLQYRWMLQLWLGHLAGSAEEVGGALGKHGIGHFDAENGDIFTKGFGAENRGAISRSDEGSNSESTGKNWFGETSDR